MRIALDDLAFGACVIALKGRMDVMGAGAIHPRFAAMAAASRAVIDDMAEAGRIASRRPRRAILVANPPPGSAAG